MNPTYMFPQPRPALKNTQYSRTLLSCTWNSSSPSSGVSTPSTTGSSNSTITLGSSGPSTPYFLATPPSPHVHFPSSGLAKTYAAYSRTEYDRTPTVVSENACAMPKRGCPGRTFYAGSTGSSPAERMRTGRPLQRVATPGPSRSGSRTRSESPDSPRYFISPLYQEYPFPPSSSVPSLVTDQSSSSSSSTSSEDLPEQTSAAPTDPAYLSQQLSGLNFLFPEYACAGSSPSVYAPGHPPIPIPHQKNVYDIAQALNGMHLSSSESESCLGITGLVPSSTSPKRVVKKKKVACKVMFKKEEDGCLGGF